MGCWIRGRAPVGAAGLLALPTTPAGLSIVTAAPAEHLPLSGPSRDAAAPCSLSPWLGSLAEREEYGHISGTGPAGTRRSRRGAGVGGLRQ